MKVYDIMVEGSYVRASVVESGPWQPVFREMLGFRVGQTIKIDRRAVHKSFAPHFNTQGKDVCTHWPCLPSSALQRECHIVQVS